MLLFCTCSNYIWIKRSIQPRKSNPKLKTTEENILCFKTLFDIYVNEIKLLKNMADTGSLKETLAKDVYIWIKWLNERDRSTIFKNV